MRFEYYSLLFTASSLLLISLTSGGELVPNTTVDKNERIHFMKKLSGAACAYTASWLAHINLFRRTTWYVSFSRNYCTPPILLLRTVPILSFATLKITLLSICNQMTKMT